MRPLSPLLVVLVFGAMFEDAGELGVVEISLLVNGRLAEELVHVFICEAVAHGGQQLPQMVLVDDTCGGEYGKYKDRTKRHS